VFLAGILATFAMSVGTALTVSALAVMTMLFRRTAVGMVDGSSQVAGIVESGLGLIAGLFLLLLGSLLLWGSFTVPVAPFRV
jgi:ABC-type nickel/cobalt efflux system permease component RcnA